jgi:DNA-binding Xre family transcriptional regulator
MINYNKLWHILVDRQMTKEALKNKAGLSSATMTKISKGESVTLKTINAICNVLQVQPGDILEWVPDESTKN